MAGHMSVQNPPFRSGVGSPSRHIRDPHTLVTKASSLSLLTHVCAYMRVESGKD